MFARLARNPLVAGMAMIVAIIALPLALHDDPPGSQPPVPGPAEAVGGSSGEVVPGIDPEVLLSCAEVQPASGSRTPPVVSVAPASVGDRGELRRLTRRVATRVQRLRGLSFERPIEVAFLGEEALTSRVESLTRTETKPRQLAATEGALVALGAIPADADLERLLGETLSGQIAGLYVPETGELLVRAGGGPPGPVEELTVAHELEHALADQALGLPVPERLVPSRSDAIGAALALVEGDATLTMQLYAERHLSIGDQLGLLFDDGLADAERDFDEIPDFLQRQLLFPYTEGLAYTCARAAGRDIAAIDRAYREPPRSTWEILFPERDPGRLPLDPPELGEPGSDWSLAERTQLGAAELSWLFAAPGGDPSRGLDAPDELVSGWRGSTLEIWTEGSEVALGASFASRGRKLCGAVVAWYRERDPDAAVSAGERNGPLFRGADQVAAVRCGSSSVRIGIAPDARAARALAAATR